MIGSESTWSQSWSAMFSTHFCQPSSGNNTTTECYSFISYRYKSRWHSHIRHILSTNIGRPTILFSSAPVVPCFALDSVSVSPTAWESFFSGQPCDGLLPCSSTPLWALRRTWAKSLLRSPPPRHVERLEILVHHILPRTLCPPDRCGVCESSLPCASWPTV